MPSIGFTVLKDKILSGEKRQTIRKARKIPIREGQPLYLYWHLRQKDCEFLDLVICKEVKRVKYSEFAYDDEIARLDGFKDSSELRAWFDKVHNPRLDDLFDIIRW